MQVNICAGGKAVQSWNTQQAESVIDGLQYDMQAIVETGFSKMAKKAVPVSIVAPVAFHMTNAMAATDQTAIPTMGHVDLYTKMLPLINMIQDLALPVGIIVASWGMIETIIGNPGGKTKLKLSVIGYVGMFFVPIVFKAIHDAFQS